MGVNTDVVISFTFGLGSALAAAAGILFAVNYPAIDPLMGILPGLKAFVAAVLGGIGNLPGAALGGLIIGVTETLVAGYISSTYRDAIAFGILILILLIKPSGLLGKKELKKYEFQTRQNFFARRDCAVLFSFARLQIELIPTGFSSPTTSASTSSSPSASI